MSGFFVLPPTATLAHFCERCGPSTVVATQRLRLREESEEHNEHGDEQEHDARQCEQPAGDEPQPRSQADGERVGNEESRKSVTDSQGLRKPQPQPMYRFPAAFLREVWARGSSSQGEGRGAQLQQQQQYQHDQQPSTEVNTIQSAASTTLVSEGVTTSTPTSSAANVIERGFAEADTALRIQVHERQYQDTIPAQGGLDSSAADAVEVSPFFMRVRSRSGAASVRDNGIQTADVASPYEKDRDGNGNDVIDGSGDTGFSYKFSPPFVRMPTLFSPDAPKAAGLQNLMSARPSGRVDIARSADSRSTSVPLRTGSMDGQLITSPRFSPLLAPTTRFASHLDADKALQVPHVGGSPRLSRVPGNAVDISISMDSSLLPTLSAGERCTPVEASASVVAEAPVRADVAASGNTCPTPSRPPVTSLGSRRSPSVSNVKIHVKKQQTVTADPSKRDPAPATGPRGSPCDACRSFQRGRGLFSMNPDETVQNSAQKGERSYFVTTAKPPPACYAAVRTATLRVLSSELAPGGRGALLLSFRDADSAIFGTDKSSRLQGDTMWLFAYMFSLKDALHRGQNRRYAFIVMLPTESSELGSAMAQHSQIHSYVLVRCADFVTRFFSKIVDTMQETCNSRFARERKQVAPATRVMRTGVRSSIPNRFSQADSSRVRTLADLLDDENFFVTLHHRFCWLLRSLAESLFVVELDPHWLPLTTAAVAAAERKKSSVRLRAEANKFSGTSSLITNIVSENVSLCELVAWTGMRDLSALLHHLLVGNQVVVRLNIPEPKCEVDKGTLLEDLPRIVSTIDSIVSLLRRLVPFASMLVSAREWTDRYCMPWECTLLSLLSFMEGTCTANDSQGFAVGILRAAKIDRATFGDKIEGLDDVVDPARGIAIPILDITWRALSDPPRRDCTKPVRQIASLMERWTASISTIADCEKAMRNSRCQLYEEYMRIVRARLSPAAEASALSFVKEGWKTKARQYARTLLECEDPDDPRMRAVQRTWRLNASDEMCLRHWAGAVRRADRLRQL